jgi:hypothetical protein
VRVAAFFFAQKKEPAVKRVPDIEVVYFDYAALRRTQPRSPSADPNSQTAAGTGITTWSKEASSKKPAPPDPSSPKAMNLTSAVLSGAGAVPTPSDVQTS